MNNLNTDLKKIEAHSELKRKITSVLWNFTEEHAYPGSEMYPYFLSIMADVLEESLKEVNYQRGFSKKKQ